MNIAMRLTMSGLIRTLKSTAHDLAERVDRGEDLAEDLVARRSHARANLIRASLEDGDGDAIGS